MRSGVAKFRVDGRDYQVLAKRIKAEDRPDTASVTGDNSRSTFFHGYLIEGAGGDSAGMNVIRVFDGNGRVLRKLTLFSRNGARVAIESIRQFDHSRLIVSTGDSFYIFDPLNPMSTIEIRLTQPKEMARYDLLTNALGELTLIEKLHRGNTILYKVESPKESQEIDISKLNNGLVIASNHEYAVTGEKGVIAIKTKRDTYDHDEHHSLVRLLDIHGNQQMQIDVGDSEIKSVTYDNKQIYVTLLGKAGENNKLAIFSRSSGRRLLTLGNANVSTIAATSTGILALGGGGSTYIVHGLDAAQIAQKIQAEWRREADLPL